MQIDTKSKNANTQSHSEHYAHNGQPSTRINPMTPFHSQVSTQMTMHQVPTNDIIPSHMMPRGKLGRNLLKTNKAIQSCVKKISNNFIYNWMASKRNAMHYITINILSLMRSK